jgi:hypothetical protein
MVKEPIGPEVFWGEMSPCDHIVQIYEEDSAVLDALEGFIAGGLLKGEAAVVIATPAHRKSLDRRLAVHGIDIVAASAGDRYVTLDAAETLATFMRNGWPDDDLFTLCVRSVLDRARSTGQPVRAFGEMVALLWAQGHSGATVHLEHLWHALCRSERFTLFCAYPRSGFTKDATESIEEICAAHTKRLH